MSRSCNAQTSAAPCAAIQRFHSKHVPDKRHSFQTADTTCALSGSISGAGKSIEIRLRMCGPPLFQTLYGCCLTKRSCHFLVVARVGLCCWFCDFAVSFLVPPDGPKNGTVKVLFFCSFTKLCMRSQKWDRQAVPFLGPCSGSFFEVFCIKVAEAQRFGFNEALWLMATGRATREALLSEAGFEKVFRTQNRVRRSKLFCRWFCFLLRQAGCISVAAWTQLKVAFYYFVSSGGLIVCC